MESDSKQQHKLPWNPMVFPFMLMPLGKTWVHLFSTGNMGKLLSRLSPLALIWQPILKNEIPELKPNILPLKIDLV